MYKCKFFVCRGKSWVWQTSSWHGNKPKIRKRAMRAKIIISRNRGIPQERRCSGTRLSVRVEDLIIFSCQTLENNKKFDFEIAPELLELDLEQVLGCYRREAIYYRAWKCIDFCCFCWFYSADCSGVNSHLNAERALKI